MNLFSRKSVIPPPSLSPSPSIGSAATAGPEAFANNSAYGRGFFEPGAYSIALKRCENGHDLAQQLADMYEERAQLELVYTNQLRAWSRKWHGELVKSQEYGTNKKVWDQSVTTGEQMADVHGILSSSLTDSLIPKLRQWRKDNYEKSLVHYKKTKEFEKDFIDAQKSWAKLLDKISEYKSSYYSACKTAKLADNAERTATEEQRRKLADKAEVARREVGFAKTKYEQALNEAREQRSSYETAMKNVFERTQTFERKRLDFFKETFDEFSKVLETATIDNPILKKMNEDYQASLNMHSSDQDLTWWDQNYGTQTNNRWPEYEEYRD
ncbi:unnamed protein product [Adineta steineri]|uniref:F-BAR domain-containing protein n=1 Tax=Adineta steineri TaxID=433720 RepID=A0A813T6M4_9BILA|nr:unnamed protein product [Adineta steineri]CAF0899315.1 unnamed protein product [Adineta steineri]CAF3653538.1 unnamed protein product [Adineta steineri]CAF3778305.1 unnamed protein product [Adineta steineri]